MRHPSEKTSSATAGSSPVLQLFLPDPGHTKIEQLYFAVRRDQDVARLHVGMNDTQTMCIVECLGNLLDDIERRLLVDLLAAAVVENAAQ
jgi:hypothetical protein